MSNSKSGIVCSVLSAVTLCASVACAAEEATVATSDVQPLIHWLLEDEGRLDDVPFRDVVQAVSNCEVLPVDPKNEVDARMLNTLSEALNDCLSQLNAEGQAIHEVGRVNEISRHVEDSLLKLLNAKEGLLCEVPMNASGKRQRSGYPVIRTCDYSMKPVDVCSISTQKSIV